MSSPKICTYTPLPKRGLCVQGQGFQTGELDAPSDKDSLQDDGESCGAMPSVYDP
jgi:hypothetical protein